jgi:hypothetical protein
LSPPFLQEFLESFRTSTTACNAHFVQERDKLTAEYEHVLKQLQAARRAIATLSRGRQSLKAAEASRGWQEIREVSPICLSLIPASYVYLRESV